MGLLQDKVAVITGGTRGLGLAIAQAYAKEGATVVVSSRHQAAVDRTVEQIKADGGKASGFAADVGDLAQVEALARHAIDAYGHFDIWVNNAGYSPPYGPTAHIPPEYVDRAIRTNIYGTYHGSRVALGHFLASGDGKLINIMGRGEKKPVPFQNPYAASKAWVRSFTDALIKEYEGTGVGIHTLQPGMMTTDMLTSIDAIQGYETRLNVMDTIIRMWANPPEVPAEQAVLLASVITDGKTGAKARTMNFGKMVAGAVREGLRRLFRQPAEHIDVQVTTIPADLSLD